MSSCESDCICCCLPCIAVWASIYFTYAGIRGACRWCHGKCNPEPPSDTPEGRARLGEDEKRYPRTTHPHLSYGSEKTCQDVSSVITEVQEPEKAYYPESMIRTQPQPIQGMSSKPSQMVYIGQSVSVPIPPPPSTMPQYDTPHPSNPDHWTPSAPPFAEDGKDHEAPGRIEAVARHTLYSSAPGASPPKP